MTILKTAVYQTTLGTEESNVVERCLLVKIQLHTGFGESVVVTETCELSNVYRSFIILRSNRGLNFLQQK